MKKVLMALGLLLVSGGCLGPTDPNSCGLSPFDYDCGYNFSPSPSLTFQLLVDGVVKENGIPTPAGVRVFLEKDGTGWAQATAGTSVANGYYAMTAFLHEEDCPGYLLRFKHPDGREGTVPVPNGCGRHAINYDFGPVASMVAEVQGFVLDKGNAVDSVLVQMLHQGVPMTDGFLHPADTTAGRGFYYVTSRFDGGSTEGLCDELSVGLQHPDGREATIAVSGCGVHSSIFEFQ